MSPQALHRGIQRELLELEERGLLEPAQRQALAARYPATPWDLTVLARWLTILGAVAMGAGVLVLARHLGTAVRLAELGCGLAFPGALLGARALARRGLEKAAAAAELAAGFALQGLVVAVAVDLSTGSDDWPALVGVCAALLVALAYALGNRLVLIHALVNVFVWFGGRTGYVSGWGAYWLGMTYPVRFLAAGVVTLGVAWLHARLLAGPRQGFARVYLHFGLLVLHLALWFLSVFGYFEDHDVRWDGTEGERLLFSLAWALLCLGSLWAAGQLGQRTLRSYALVFGVIDLYTFYFQFIAARSGEWWFVHLLVAGGSLVALGFRLERTLRAWAPGRSG